MCFLTSRYCDILPTGPLNHCPVIQLLTELFILSRVDSLTCIYFFQKLKNSVFLIFYCCKVNTLDYSYLITVQSKYKLSLSWFANCFSQSRLCFHTFLTLCKAPPVAEFTDICRTIRHAVKSSLFFSLSSPSHRVL